MIHNFVSVIIAFITIATAAAEDFKVDLRGPDKILQLPRMVPLPTRVEVYVTGPRTYIDKADTPASLANAKPDCVLTNAVEINKLISALGRCDYQARIVNVTKRNGYTFHLLFFNNLEHTVMHFRIFKTTEFETPWCVVDPRNETGAISFNNQIGSWLTSIWAIGTCWPK